MFNLVKKIFGSGNKREISRIKKTVNIINDLEDKYSKLNVSQLKDKFEEFKNIAASKGFLLVSSSPLTRSSYHADDDFAMLKKNKINPPNAQSIS